MIHVEGYLNTVNAPWGKLFYRLVWHTIECSGKNILDFGSGFGITADHFAENNTVIAVEPNKEMLVHRFCKNDYRQLVGGMEMLKTLPSQSFDMVLCHNVLEYIENRFELLNELHRVLKPDGCFSLVKHNRTGKIMQKAVFEYKPEEAIELLQNGKAVSENFGVIDEYDLSELQTYCNGIFCIEKLYGVRTFFGLQSNKFKNEDDWFSQMYRLECAVEGIPHFSNIAFYHHLILKPTNKEVAHVES